MKQPTYSIIFQSPSDFLDVMGYINDNLSPSTGNAETVTPATPPAALAAAMMAPISATTPAQHPQIGVDLDASGTPHIPGIHSDNKQKDENGFWKGRRGIGKPARETQEALARAKLAATPVPTIPAGVTVPSLPGMPAVAAPAPVAAAPVVPSLPGMPSLPAVAAPVALPVIAAPPVEVVTMQQISDYAGHLAANGWQLQHFQAVYKQAGVVNMADLETNETLRAAVLAELKKAAGQ